MKNLNIKSDTTTISLIIAAALDTSACRSAASLLDELHNDGIDGDWATDVLCATIASRVKGLQGSSLDDQYEELALETLRTSAHWQYFEYIDTRDEIFRLFALIDTFSDLVAEEIQSGSLSALQITERMVSEIDLRGLGIGTELYEIDECPPCLEGEKQQATEPVDFEEPIAIAA